MGWFVRGAGAVFTSQVLGEILPPKPATSISGRTFSVRRAPSG